MKGRKRPYVQKARRRRREQTRMRIVRALVALHQEVGPKNTTIAAVAERAGVQRLTVYRHFADESAMLHACSSHWASENPPPHDGAWQDLKNSEERLYTALLAIHRYFAGNDAMLAKVYRDASEVAPLAPIMNGFDQHFTNIADRLAGEAAKGKPDDRLKAVARHLVRFSTWQSLARENLSEEEIARVGVKWLKQLAG